MREKNLKGKLRRRAGGKNGTDRSYLKIQKKNMLSIQKMKKMKTVM